MNIINYTQPKAKYKHLSAYAIENIVNSVVSHNGKYKKQVRNTGKTELIQSLAQQHNTTVSNIYNILKDASVTLRTTSLTEYQDLSALAAINKRSKKNKPSNISKLKKAEKFIDIVVSKVKDRKTLDSIDETVNHLRLYDEEWKDNHNTVCTKTIYNYIHSHKIALKPIDLPRMAGWKRKIKPKDKLSLTKHQKGTPITQRPFAIDDRSTLGNWEGDLVTGPRDGKNGAYLTLVERKTRMYIMIPIKSKSSKQVYMAINKLDKFYGIHFKDIFKSITFDNGNEFARHKDIERKPGTNAKRTNVYFATPYCSYERGSNENANGLIRRYIKKGTDINIISNETTTMINQAINNKKRKIHHYRSSLDLFNDELNKLNVPENKRVFQLTNITYA